MCFLFLLDAQESSQDDCDEIIPKKVEPTIEETSPLHSLQVFIFYFILPPIVFQIIFVT